MLSVIIIVKDEEANIRRCLTSVQWADEIIVLDSGSSDNTVAIAKEFTKNVYCTDWQGYGIQKQRTLSYATGDWVLNLDADETVDENLKNAIKKAMSDNQADAYRIPIRMNFYGKLLRFSICPKRHIRLFKRAGACYSDDIIHEKVILPASARVARLKAAIQHHSFQDVSHALSKMNKYSSYTARIRIQQQKSPSLLKILAASSWMFFRCYFLQRGFLDGKAGFLLAVLSSQGTFYRGIKQHYRDSHTDKLPKILKE
ncbi:lipopolysaccharide biosynthesis glycosyltransferase [Legionella lansingensis]|uniref:Lipopolysaccharide biosynthesis glycosyltransferase n=1 Tax=Legionella lansingensis TaxID=45067 RepID=A0A0W0VJW4_9GAMM|nr:glycosyltransferase family 2 protein [Legionella lansingensis]KTD20400.1 lipopolysaccharide biosynthesis glycosyltransferase [Legionella lansingensis]SNV51597.1 lipopolysaccharide biosynthesis glycosyltransferase [Legionella lansingensis]